MEKKYQIFVSSTFEDLKEERKKVQDTILSMYQFPIGMEMFSAADEEQWEIIQDTIDSSDYYVLIIGHRYGSVINEGRYAGISYTEKEFKYALEKGIPILAFIIDNGVPIVMDKIESDIKKRDKLESFKKDVMTGRTVQWWTSIEDLANKVMNSLNKEISKGKRPGWVRADKINIEDLQTENMELNRLVRRLEEEKAELQKQIVYRKPKFTFIINAGKQLKYQYKPIDVEYIKDEYRLLTKEDVEPYEISENEIDEYNKSLPTMLELNEYKEKCWHYQNIKKNAIPFSITYKNQGNEKANDVHIRVDFSDGLIIMEKKSVNELESPKKPVILEHPVDKYIKKKSGIDKIEKIYETINYGTLKNECLFNISDYEVSTSIYYSEYIENNKLVIWERSLIHTGEGCSKEYFLIPLCKGKFMITVSVICEEYLEQVVEHISLDVL